MHMHQKWRLKHQVLTNKQKLTLTFRAILELSIVIAFGYWGFHFSNRDWVKIVFLFFFPIVGFGIWGAIDFHQFENAELFRLVEELIISLIASYGLYLSNQTLFSLFLASLTIIYHILVYSFGERLLKTE